MNARTLSQRASFVLGSAANAQTTRITLKLSVFAVIFHNLAILVAAALVLATTYYASLEMRLVARGEAPFRPEEAAVFLALVTVSIAVIVRSYRKLSRIAGYIETCTLGLVLDTYDYAGILSTGQVEAVGKVRSFGTKYLGIRVKDIDAFVASRSMMKAHNVSGELAPAQAYVRLLLALLPLPLASLVLRVSGYSKLPRPPAGAGLLRWNAANCRYHILIPAAYVPRFSRTLRALSAYAGRPN